MAPARRQRGAAQGNHGYLLTAVLPPSCEGRRQEAIGQPNVKLTGARRPSSAALGEERKRSLAEIYAVLR